MIGTNEILFLVSVTFGTFVFNFISIHVMANLILKEGSSKGKSVNLSLQYALLSTMIALISLLVLKVTGRADKISAWNALVFVATGDGSLVFLVKWWYTKKKYETTYLFSFIIVEWLYIIISLVSLAILNFL